MDKERLIERLKNELSDLNWKERKERKYTDLESNFACAFILAGDTYSGTGFGISIHVAKKILNYIEKNNLDITGRFKKVFNFEDGFTSIDDIDDHILDLTIKGLKNWKNYIDGLRKSKDERDQLILIHPDWDIESFKKDFKIVCGEDGDWRLGIMSTGEWNFSNDELCDELNKNSCDCFGIGSFYDMMLDWDSLEEFLEDKDLTEEYEELKKKYPDVNSIKDIYDTDFD